MKGEEARLRAHRLDALWQDFEMMLPDVGAAIGWVIPPDDVEGVRDYIAQLTKADGGSFAFRYPRNQEGGLSLPGDLRTIHLRNFAEAMERLADYLDGLDEGLRQRIETCAEMEAEAGSFEGDL